MLAPRSCEFPLVAQPSATVQTEGGWVRWIQNSHFATSFNQSLTQQVISQCKAPIPHLRGLLSLLFLISLQETDWKLVLLLVPADSMCACSPDVRFIYDNKIMLDVAYLKFVEAVTVSFVLQVAADVNAAVREVEAALELLQKRVLCLFIYIYKKNNSTMKK